MILITGAAGFIGSHLTEKLLANNEKVIAIDNLDPFYDVNIKLSNLNLFKDKVKIFKTSITDNTTWEHLEKNDSPNSIIHLAALAGVRSSIDRIVDYYKNNVIGTINVLEYAKRNSIKNIVIASSSSVYGNSSEIPFLESETNLKPISPYGCSKLAVEDICRNYSYLYGIKITLLRYFTVYGPRQRPDLVIHKFIKAALLDCPIILYGDGSNYRDYTYIDDITDATVKALTNTSNTLFNIYNVGSNNPIQLIELIDIIEKFTQCKLRVEKQKYHDADAKYTYANISKIKKELNWSPNTSFNDGMNEFIQWAKWVYK